MKEEKSRAAKAERDGRVHLTWCLWLINEGAGPNQESNFLRATQHMGRAGAQSPDSQASIFLLHCIPPVLLHPYLHSSMNTLPAQHSFLPYGEDY